MYIHSHENWNYLVTDADLLEQSTLTFRVQGAYEGRKIIMNKSDDTIRRQAAIDAVEKESQVDGSYGYMDTKSIVDLLNDLPSAQRWIPVSERLPEPNNVYKDVLSYYLVQNEYGDMMVATFIKFPGGARVWQQIYQYGAIMEDIVAWMPLPEPWKGEEDE